MKTTKNAPTYAMNLDEEGRLIMLTPEELRLYNIDQKLALTRKNNGESPTHWLENVGSSNPIYNMGLTSVDSRLQCDHFTFPRKLDNVKMILTEKGNLPILHSVPCDEYGIASHDWITASFDASTLGEEYSSIHPDEVESALTHAIENVLDHHLYEIFGFGLEKKREKGMHNYKYAYELQDMMGMVLYGHR